MKKVITVDSMFIRQAIVEFEKLEKAGFDDYEIFAEMGRSTDDMEVIHYMLLQKFDAIVNLGDNRRFDVTFKRTADKKESRVWWIGV